MEAGPAVCETAGPLTCLARGRERPCGCESRRAGGPGPLGMAGAGRAEGEGPGSMSSRAFASVIAEAMRNPFRRSGSVLHLYRRLPPRASTFGTLPGGRTEPFGTRPALPVPAWTYAVPPAPGDGIRARVDTSTERHGLDAAVGVGQAQPRRDVTVVRRADDVDRRVARRRHEDRLPAPLDEVRRRARG